MKAPRTRQGYWDLMAESVKTEQPEECDEWVDEWVLHYTHSFLG